MSLPSAPLVDTPERSRRPHRVPGGRAVTAYDFRRPIQLSRELQRVLEVCFEGFARQATTVFTSALRRICQVRVLGLDQVSYSEYVDALDARSYLMMFTIDPIPGHGVITTPLAAVMSCVDHMLGGPGNATQPDRPLTEIENGVITGLMARLLAEMRYSLGSVVEIEGEISGVEYRPQFAQVAGAADVMVVTTLELRIDERTHQITVCLPFVGLHPHLLAAAAPAPVSVSERSQRAEAAALLARSFDEVPVDVSVRFRSLSLGPDALTELAVGDVLRLGHPSSAPLDVGVDDQVFAHATAGTKGSRLAALVVAARTTESRTPAVPTSPALRPLENR